MPLGRTKMQAKYQVKIVAIVQDDQMRRASQICHYRRSRDGGPPVTDSRRKTYCG
jgi:hypothetical protein